MKQRVILSTHNEGKVRELRDLLGEGYDVQTKQDVNLGALDIPETGTTLEENARLKVVGLYRALLEMGEDPDQVWILADDTGLFVDALDGRPGIYAARYAGAEATYEDNVQKLIHEMQGVAWAHRTAQFRTVIALCRGGMTETVEGQLEGMILEAPRGDNGFGYDPIFYVPAEGKTLAEMSEEAKNQISHRARAYQALHRRLGKRATDAEHAAEGDAPDA